MKTITQPPQPKRWIKPGVFLFLLASFLTVVLIGPASPARGRVAAIITEPAEPPVTWRGEEAIAQLKQLGSYDSLEAAMAATRYQLRWVERPTLAGLRSQGRSSYVERRFLPTSHTTPCEQKDRGEVRGKNETTNIFANGFR